MQPIWQWFAVSVMLEGATSQECAQAVEEMREELQQREYLRHPTVTRQPETDNPVFRVEVVASDAENAEQFILDEIYEVGGAYLPDIDDFSVILLSTEPVEGEEGIWPPGIVLTVSHWPAHTIAIVSGSVFIFFTVLGALIKSPLLTLFFGVAFLVCVWLLLTFGKTTLTERGIEHAALLGRYAMEWDQITEVVISSMGNTIMLKGKEKQLILPMFSFWSGSEKHVAQDALRYELERRAIPLKASFVALAVQRNTRVR